MPQTVIGFDVGHKKIGIAVGQSVTRAAQGIDVIHVHSGEPEWARLTTVFDQWRPDHIVVGMPTTADGKKTPLMIFIEQFAAQLTRRFQRNVSFVDESLTSAEADFRMRSNLNSDPTRAYKSAGKKRIAMRDSVAAALIIESWFNDSAD